MGDISAFQDNFDDNSYTDWTEFEGGDATIAEQNQQIEMDYGPSPASGSDDAYITSDYDYNIDEDTCSIEILEYPAGSGKTSIWLEFRLFDSSSNLVRFVILGDDKMKAQYYLGASVQTVGSEVSYSLTTHKYLRFREASGVMYWETSSDGDTWDDPFSGGNWTHGTIDHTNLFIRLAGYCSANNTGVYGCTFDDLNIVPAGGTTVQIGNATVALVGKALVINAAEDIGITKAAIALVGRALVTNAAEDISITKGNIALTGRAAPNINIKKTVTITKATITVAGQALVVLAARIIQITKAAIALAGKSLNVNIKKTITITKGAIALVGRALNVNASIILQITKGTIGLVGQALVILADKIITITKGTISLAGGALVVNASSLLQIAKGTIALVGKSVTVISGTLIQIGKATITLVGRALGVNEGAEVLKKIKTWLYYRFRGR